MKILFIFDRVAHYHEPLFIGLNQRLSGRGHRLYLLSGQPKAQESGRVGISRKIVDHQRSYRFHEFKLLSYTLRYQENIVSQVKDINPDIVVVPGHVGNLSSWRLGRNKNGLGFRLFSWQCGYEYHDNYLKHSVTKRYLDLFDHHLAYHSNAKKYLLSHGIGESRISVIFNTIDESKIKRRTKEEAARELVKIHPGIRDKRIVLFVGAVLAEKKLDSLVEAFDRLGRRDAVLMIVGDGPYLNTLKGRTAGLADILFAGRVIEDAGNYFDAADVFVLPGTGGLAINEAMAHGLPVISGYADGSADDLVVNGKTGFRLQGDAVEEISRYLSLLLDDASLRETLGRNAMELLNGDYSFHRFLDRVETALLGPPPAPSEYEPDKLRHSSGQEKIEQ